MTRSLPPAAMYRRAIYEATGQELHAMVAGIVPGLLLCVGVLAASTALGAAVGAAIGALAFGTLAAPGAVVGAQAGFERERLCWDIWGLPSCCPARAKFGVSFSFDLFFTFLQVWILVKDLS